MQDAKKNILFIVNPFAGYHSKENVPSLIEKMIPRDKFNIDIVMTKYAGHANELAAEAVNSSMEAVVAVGGDGTLNEVASALVYTDKILGIVPGGSGNGLSMHLGIGRSKKKALFKISQFDTKIIDAAKVNDRFFVNMAGIGVDGLVAYKTKLSSRRGFSTYFKGAVWEGLKYKNQHYKVEVDGREYEGKFLSVNVANGSMFGYNFTIAPDADTSDGLMNALMIHDAHKMDYFGNAWRFFAKRIHKSKLASTEKSTNIKLTAYEDSYMHVDGEGYPIEAGEFEFTIMSDALKIIC
jgi:YegS/Rv2252/BmrU family lipid kinase